MESLQTVKLSDLQSFDTRAKNLYHIRSEQNELINYTFNEAQVKLNQYRNEEFERSEQRKGVEQCKLIILKGRQVGATTDTAMFNMDIMLNLKYARGLILAHDDLSTPLIYDKYKKVYDNLPEQVLVVDDYGNPIVDEEGNRAIWPIKPRKENYSGYSLSFADKTESAVFIRTAGSGDNVGKGDTINFVHFCLGKDSKIILSDGSTKTIEEIELGDYVITSSGSKAPVTNKFNTGVKDVYKFRTWLSNEYIYPTGEHKVLTDEGYKLAKDITTEDWIALPNLKLTNEIKEYTTPGPIKETIKLDEDFGYLIGHSLTEESIINCISEWFFGTNKDFILGIVLGYLSNNPYFSKNESIVRQLRRLLIASDVGVSSVTYTDGYELKVNVFSDKYKKVDGCYYVRVKEITPHETQQTYDIEVGHEDHNFETVSGIVSNSEAANYEHYKDVLSSVNQMMPKDSFIYSVIESTANGITGKGEGFFNAWTQAEREWSNFVNGRSTSFEGYRPVFIPWYDMKKYRMPLIGGKFISLDGINFHSLDDKREYLQKEERVIEDVFGGSDEGLEAVNWYRWCIKENCQYDLHDALRYYPHEPKDAFLASDKGFFDGAKLFTVKVDFEKNGEPKSEQGDLDDDFEFTPSTSGNLKVWEHPDPSYFDRYIVSLDPSFGIEGGDYSCMMVFDRLEEKFVAKWYGNMKEDIVAEELLKLAYYYNTAMIIPEMNLRTVLTLIEPDGIMPYEGEIYERDIVSRNTVEYGFNTLGNTRKELLLKYNAWLRENYNRIPDTESLGEHTTFVKNITRGIPKYEASSGNHDDIVIAMALCIEGHSWWENEIYTLDEGKQNIDMIYEVKTSNKRKPIKQSTLGRK